MRAYREANTQMGVNVLTLAQFMAVTPATRSSDVLYVIADFVTGSTTHVNIQDVWIGNVSQNILVGNDGALLWTGSVDQTASMPVAITGFTAPALTTGTPLNVLV